MSDELIARARKLVLEATAGPWESIDTIDGGVHGCDEVVAAACDPCDWSGCSGARVVASDADRSLIAAAPTLIIELVDELEDAEAQVALLSSQLYD